MVYRRLEIISTGLSGSYSVNVERLETMSVNVGSSPTKVANQGVVGSSPTGSAKTQY